MKLSRLAKVMFVLLATACIADTAGARMYRSFSQEAPFYTPPPPDRYNGIIVIKFHNGSDIQGAPDRARLFRSAAGGKNADLERLRSSLLKAEAKAPLPTFTRPAAELRAERAAAERNAGEELPDLALFFDIPVPDYRAAVALLEELRTNALVETAFARTLPVAPPTPDLSTNQIYLGPAATNGYDVHFAWSKPGGSGSQARLIDIEYDWTFSHEDLKMSPTNLLWGDLYTYYGPDHGTASVGISGALSNGFGMSGIIHNGSIRMISPVSGLAYVLANAINQAVAFTSPGDVILLEQQDVSATFTNYCPVEIKADVYSAIANATALGRVIIEPAGNGGLDLDNPGWGGIFQRSTRDSGAIMIGAGTCTNRSRCSFSCYGSRLDIQGWGDWSVATLGYTNLYGSTETNCYTDTFSGTSSASALSAAIAAAIQSYARVNYGFYLPPLLLRSNLVQSGYAQNFGRPGNIGPLPNLRNAFFAVDMLVMVTPADGLSAQGCHGGPFSPSNQVYALTNAGPVSATWTFTHTQSWVNVAPAGVTLATFASTQVVVSVNAAAGALAPGQYADTVVFSNVTAGGSQARTVALTVTKANQAITFPNPGNQAITKTVGLSATASSGLPVSFVVGSGLAQITGGTNLSFTGTGTVSIVAGQAGDADWNPAPNVTNSFTVSIYPVISSGVCADYDGDGLADPAVYDEATGAWRIKLSGANYYQIVTTLGGLGGPGAASVSADYDGDKKADPAVYYELPPSTGSPLREGATPGQTGRAGDWKIMLSSANYEVVVVLAQPLGGVGYSGMPADYDGDRKADPGVYQRERGDWQVMLSSANYYTIECLGLLGGTGYRAAAADYDGDKKSDPTVYGETAGEWMIMLSSAGYRTITLDGFPGGCGYIPCPADYDGDGLADPAVKSSTGNEWIAMLSSAGYTPVHVTLPFE